MSKARRPTMVDIAADAGVSLKTVSRVVNGQPNVRRDLAERVEASIVKLGFRRNAIAASLRSGRKDTIGIVTADLMNGFYATIAAAASNAARESGARVLIASSEENPAAERQLALDLCQMQVAGLIVVPTGPDQRYLVPEVATGTPVVFLDRAGGGLDADVVLIDNVGGARAGVAELLAAGHRRVALLFDSFEIETMVERRAGAEEAFTAAAVTHDPELLISGLHTPELAREALHGLLTLADPPTAVFCANNRVAIGALEELVATGTELAVCGFDDFEAARLAPWPIRIVDYDAAELGRTAAELLLGKISGERAEAAPARVLLFTQLVDRGGRGR